MKGLFISGSGTNVGKTFIAQQLISVLQTQRTVYVRKPVESDCALVEGKPFPKDANLLQECSQAGESMAQICPFRFMHCSSPENASQQEKNPLLLSDLVKASQAKGFVLIEGAGGLFSPIASNALNSDLVSTLDLPLVLVVKDELGAVNQALLSLQAAKSAKLKVCFLVLNQIQPNGLNNARSIRAYTQVPIVVYNQGFEVDILALI
jgi:dethiobiotin synthetase